jgi:hypothetical protein
MVYHLCTSRGNNCGIASFSEKIDDNIKDITPISSLVDINVNKDDTLLVEHEYGLHNDIPFPTIDLLECRKVCIMHAYSTLDKYNIANKIIATSFDEIIFLTKTCKTKAATYFPDMMSKMKVVPHYAEELIEAPRSFDLHDPISIGIHGFGFPRNGFTKVINWVIQSDQQIHLHILASINTFDKTAEKETSVHIDKLRRIIIDNNLQDRVFLDINYYETKEEVIRILRNKCDRLIHLTSPTVNYYNASGSLNTLVASGIPVYAFESIFTENFSPDLVTRIIMLDDILTRRSSDIWHDALIDYYDANNIKSFVKNLKL